MTRIEVIPDPKLMESLRSIGYDFETAIADLLDNSITASAQNIDIFYVPEENPLVGILDDGEGMTRTGIVDALRLGAIASVDSRDRQDLGRFGLGLKTASFSQARSLVVLSKTVSGVSAFRWDLDDAARSGSWEIEEISPHAMTSIRYFDLLQNLNTGTLVVWEKLDVLNPNGKEDVAKQVADLKRHLGLIFHRYIEAPNGNLRISVNKASVVPLDPFLTRHPKSFSNGVERIHIDGEHVEITAYTLPHQSNLTEEDLEKAQIAGSLAENQGLYVYRNERLVSWGSWLRLSNKDENTKLSRVKIDIPNTLDHKWHLDIQKSKVDPPQKVKKRLKTLINKIQSGSVNTQEYRGRIHRSQRKTLEYLWDVVEDRRETRYQVNLSYPLIKLFRDTLSPTQTIAFDNLIRFVADNFPIEHAAHQGSTDRKFYSFVEDSSAQISQIREFQEVFGDRVTQEEILGMLENIAPFNEIRNLDELVAQVYETSK